MNVRVFYAGLLLSLMASDASAYTVICRPEEVLEKGLKATMRIEMPPGGVSALSESFKVFATDQGLSFETWGLNGTRDWPPTTIGIETKRSGVWLVTKADTAAGTADIQIETTCYADEDWEPHWREFEAFVAGNNYRVLNTARIPSWREAQNAFAAQLIQSMSLSPLTPINTE